MQHVSIFIPKTLSVIISQCVFNVKPSSPFDVGSIHCISMLTAKLKKKRERENGEIDASFADLNSSDRRKNHTDLLAWKFLSRCLNVHVL